MPGLKFIAAMVPEIKAFKNLHSENARSYPFSQICSRFILIQNSSSPSTSAFTAAINLTPSATVSPNSAPSVSPTTPHRDSGSVGRSSDTGTLRYVSTSL